MHTMHMITIITLFSTLKKSLFWKGLTSDLNLADLRRLTFYIFFIRFKSFRANISNVQEKKLKIYLTVSAWLCVSSLAKKKDWDNVERQRDESRLHFSGSSKTNGKLTDVFCDK